VFSKRAKNSAWGKKPQGPKSEKSTHPTSNIEIDVGCVDSNKFLVEKDRNTDGPSEATSHF
jgi:hypothetical protein